ncbi:MAG: hypothetical protein JWN70_3225 [Planctomycetaceae bacterium]|nr:hypothetical protein [Planctomycetaceae bacterium]
MVSGVALATGSVVRRPIRQNRRLAPCRSGVWPQGEHPLACGWGREYEHKNKEVKGIKEFTVRLNWVLPFFVTFVAFC